MPTAPPREPVEIPASVLAFPLLASGYLFSYQSQRCSLRRTLAAASRRARRPPTRGGHSTPPAAFSLKTKEPLPMPTNPLQPPEPKDALKHKSSTYPSRREHLHAHFEKKSGKNLNSTAVLETAFATTGRFLGMGIETGERGMVRCLLS